MIKCALHLEYLKTIKEKCFKKNYIHHIKTKIRHIKNYLHRIKK